MRFIQNDSGYENSLKSIFSQNKSRRSQSANAAPNLFSKDKFLLFSNLDQQTIGTQLFSFKGSPTTRRLQTIENVLSQKLRKDESNQTKITLSSLHQRIDSYIKQNFKSIKSQPHSQIDTVKQQIQSKPIKVTTLMETIDSESKSRYFYQSDRNQTPESSHQSSAKHQIPESQRSIYELLRSSFKSGQKEQKKKEQQQFKLKEQKMKISDYILQCNQKKGYKIQYKQTEKIQKSTEKSLKGKLLSRQSFSRQNQQQKRNFFVKQSKSIVVEKHDYNNKYEQKKKSLSFYQETQKQNKYNIKEKSHSVYLDILNQVDSRYFRNKIT